MHALYINPLLDDRHRLSCVFANHGGREGLSITFTFDHQLRPSDALNQVERFTTNHALDWLRAGVSKWQLDIDKLKSWHKARNDNPFHVGLEWLDGIVAVTPEVDKQQQSLAAGGEWSTDVRFCVFREEHAVNKGTRVFLSHKGTNKPRVRPFYDLLDYLGFAPWLDEEDMPVGTILHHGIQDGMMDSCAAVFFITPEFVDASYLSREIEYAIAEQLARPNRFKIIALSLGDKDGKRGVVPKLLEPFVYKVPNSDMEAILCVLKALPRHVETVNWRPGL